MVLYLVKQTIQPLLEAFKFLPVALPLGERHQAFQPPDLVDVVVSLRKSHRDHFTLAPSFRAESMNLVSLTAPFS